MTTTTKCGGCTFACASGQTCSNGACVEGGSGGTDACTNDLATNLTLKQIAVYQSVKIPVMQDGTEVAMASRNASVVQGRGTMFRVFVSLGNGWTARELAARLTLTLPDASPMKFYSKKSVSTSSVDSDTKTTFQIFVPASAMISSLRYSVEVVECSEQTGTVGAARFPATGDTDLGVKNTGGLKVKIIPIQYDSIIPDTSPAALVGYIDALTAMYPVGNVSISIGDTLTAAKPIDWTDMLENLRAKRSSDKPSADVYYFGLVKPADSLRTYCQSSCTTGIGYVVTSSAGSSASSGRAAVGIGFGDKSSYETMLHEIGHNHGRNHSPCSTAGTITGVDNNYPYTNGALGVWGFDIRTQKLFDPSKSTDIMTYCSNQWISDYTYAGITTRVSSVNGMAMIYTPPEALSRWRIMLVDTRGPRWGIPIEEEVAAEGEPEEATIYDNTGAPLTTVIVYRTLIGDIEASMVMVPEPKSGWYAISVEGSPPLPFVAPTLSRWPVKKR